jgi:hypothetical protein
MVTKVIRIIVAVIVGAILWYAITLLLTAIHAPAIVGTFVLILGLCLIAWFVWSEFGSGSP